MLLPKMLPVSRQGTMKRVVSGRAVEATEYDDVDAAKCLCMVSETLSHETLDAVSAHGTSNALLAYGDPEARNIAVIVTRQHGEEAITGTAWRREDTLEVVTIQQALLATELPALGRVTRQADRRARPFARRAFMTCRPPLVAMRARKPCRRLRLRLLGWNVLFITPLRGVWNEACGPQAKPRMLPVRATQCQ